MHFMYVDESGDPGQFTGKNSPHFILTGIILSEREWNRALMELQSFKAYCLQQYGLPMNEEFHAAELIRPRRTPSYKNIRKSDRIRMYQEFLENIVVIFRSGKVINVCIDKKAHPTLVEFQTLAWSRMLRQYDRYLRSRKNSHGIIFSDDSNDALITSLLRRLRKYSPVAENYYGTDHFSPIDRILEDVIMRPSERSYFIQVADAIAHALYRKEYPKGSLKKFRLEHFFNCLYPILLKEAAGEDPEGIIRK